MLPLGSTFFYLFPSTHIQLVPSFVRIITLLNNPAFLQKFDGFLSCVFAIYNKKSASVGSTFFLSLFENVDKVKFVQYNINMKFMEYVYVIDSEGYVCKKLTNEVASDEKIISEKEYLKKSGLASYQKQFGHGGTRANAGRKQKFGSKLKFQIRVTEEEKEFINFAREQHLNYTSLMLEMKKV